MTIEQAISQARALQRAGRLPEAEGLCRQALAAAPNAPGALDLLGLIAHQCGHVDAAAELMGRASALAPSVASYANNLGAVLASAGRFEQAVAPFQRALELNPGSVSTWRNLAAALRGAGRLDEAIDAFRRTIALEPAHASAARDLADCLREAGQLHESIPAYRQALAGATSAADAALTSGTTTHLALTLAAVGEVAEAVDLLARAAKLAPGDPRVLTNLGAVLLQAGRLEEAVSAQRRAAELAPGHAMILNNLGTALADAGDLDAALESYRKALDLAPGEAMFLHNRGTTLQALADGDGAIASYESALRSDPAMASADSSRVYSMMFNPRFGPRDLLSAQREWARRQTGGIAPLPPAPARRARTGADRLRIGYVSGEFRDHVVGRNIFPLLREHDRSRFEIFCYSDVRRPDAWTDRFRGLGDNWRHTTGLSDAELSDRVRADEVDILVDLTLHMAGSRLRAFARRPAPVQATFAGYPGGTGLEAVDYRLTDLYLDPPGASDGAYVEKSLRLPHSFWCYDPTQDDPIPPVAELPALARGWVTFGCLNNYSKVSDAALRLWARVLRAVPASKLLTLAPAGKARSRVLETMSAEGVEPERIDFLPMQPRADYLRTYAGIDIGLDTAPYNGHTTSLDSFWMGVPVVTLVGQTAVGRAGLSQLSNLALTELARDDAAGFVESAASLAGDLCRLSGLRRGLRDRMLKSPLTDAVGFARAVESAYLSMQPAFGADRPGAGVE